VHAIEPRDDTTSLAVTRQRRDLSRVTEGQRRPLLIHEINFVNNSTSLNDVEFSKNTHVQHVVERTDARRIKQHEVCRPLLPAELVTREPAPSFIAGQTRAAHKIT